MNKLIDQTFFRFLLVGVFNTFVGSGTMFLLYNIVGCSYWLSSAANYIVGGVVSFFLNKYFTFKSHDRSLKQVGRFVINVMVCYLLAYGIAKPLVFHILSGQTVNMQENVAMLLGMCFFTGLNYLGQKFFAFRSEV